MRAVVFDAFGGHPEIKDVEEPVTADDGAVIEVRATGVCRSDWHGWMGHDPDITLPHVPGHEFAGVIASVGRGVRDWRPGQRVTVPFVCACGDCPQCRAGDHQVCADQFQPGFTGWGSFAERVAIRHADVNLVELPGQLDFVVAAGLGCRFSTAYRAVTAQGRLQPQQWLAVHGCGGVGLAAIMVAKSIGARVVAVDVSSPALERARLLGADVVIDSSQTRAAEKNVGAVVRAAAGGGADVSIDAFGSPQTCADSILSLRPRGKHIQVGLLPAEDGMSLVPMSAVIGRELEVIGSHGMSAHAFAPMLARIRDGLLDPAALIGRTISLDEAPAALVSMSSGSGGAGTTVVDLQRSIH
ncbi:MAG: Alcohol dehydrogenase GroES domain protein [Pseudonocardiales bacterium]|nr:Alcohol dehydrogenase GroES domain protein [Pseudonocardiales bacterium]